MKLHHLLFVVIISIISSFASANDGAILTVTGNITKTNQPDKKSFVFSFSELNQLPNTVIHTKTIWTPASDFKGPLMRDILKAVGVSKDAQKVEIRCINKFVVTIPLSDFERWNVILAHSQNNQRLKVAAKGPLWIMYPIDEYKADLDNNLTRPKLAWAVKEIRVF